MIYDVRVKPFGYWDRNNQVNVSNTIAAGDLASSGYISMALRKSAVTLPTHCSYCCLVLSHQCRYHLSLFMCPPPLTQPPLTQPPPYPPPPPPSPTPAPFRTKTNHEWMNDVKSNWFQTGFRIATLSVLLPEASFGLRVLSLPASVGPLALTNDTIYGPSNVCGPLRDRYDFQTL